MRSAASFGGLAHAQVSGVTVMLLAQLLLAGTLALLLAAVETKPPQLARHRAVRVAAALAGLALAVSVLLSAFLAPCAPFAGQDARCEKGPSFWSRNTAGTTVSLADAVHGGFDAWSFAPGCGGLKPALRTTLRTTHRSIARSAAGGQVLFFATAGGQVLFFALTCPSQLRAPTAIS